MPTRRKAGKGRVAFTISGLGSAQRALNALPPAIEKKVIRQAIRKSLRPVKLAVEQEAPKGETGLLADSVKIRAVKKRKRGRIALQVRIAEGDFLGETYYAAMVEFGHALRDVPRGPEVGRVPADPFMERAFDRTAKPAREEAIREIKLGVDRETRRLARQAKD